jgi:DNA-binding phage protein
MKFLKEYVPFTSKELKNAKLVVDILLDCIRNEDLETFREVLIAHLMTLNKSKIAKKAGMGRRTLYDLMDPKKKFNPELTTLSSLIHALAA